MAKLKEHHIMCAEELANHKSIRDIASTFCVDESTLRYRLERHRTGAVDGRSLQEEACAPFRPLVLEWIQEQEGQERPESVQALYERLCADHGYTGSYMSVYRFVKRRRKAPFPAPFRRVRPSRARRLRPPGFKRRSISMNLAERQSSRHS